MVQINGALIIAVLNSHALSYIYIIIVLSSIYDPSSCPTCSGQLHNCVQQAILLQLYGKIEALHRAAKKQTSTTALGVKLNDLGVFETFYAERKRSLTS